MTFVMCGTSLFLGLVQWMHRVLPRGNFGDPHNSKHLLDEIRIVHLLASKSTELVDMCSEEREHIGVSPFGLYPIDLKLTSYEFTLVLANLN